MSWLSSFLHPERGYQAAQEQMQNYYNEGKGYQQPYNQNGMNAGNGLNEQMMKLMHPEQLQEEWNKSYETSPAAMDALARNKEEGLGAASSMGLLGSSSAIRGIEGKAGEINHADRSKYLDDLMQKYMSGLGIGQNMYNTGASTANNMSTNAINAGNTIGTAAGNAQNAPGSMLSSILGGFGGLAGSALSGPIGGMIGNTIANKMGWTPWQGSNMPQQGAQ